ncbi:hypothetical protein D9611_004079 [Ephemerocybe angulata]|uniref:Uncharacterized protein n=1 Tax=Ephemerocybe angulata TaxID=980116 RepID=A0A8H5F5K9_9AGAR|nr:hypothetical protein D9611_004079 [Tulosesus angulatus]
MHAQHGGIKSNSPLDAKKWSTLTPNRSQSAIHGPTHTRRRFQSTGTSNKSSHATKIEGWTPTALRAAEKGLRRSINARLNELIVDGHVVARISLTRSSLSQPLRVNELEARHNRQPTTAPTTTPPRDVPIQLGQRLATAGFDNATPCTMARARRSLSQVPAAFQSRANAGGAIVIEAAANLAASSSRRG